MKPGLLQIPKFTNPQTLMIQGTTSDAGKSAIATGLCRLLTRHGLSVAPFKPQNMALNSAVTIDGGEIGRAQAVQAAACGIEAHTDMNPVLLKPNTDTGAQVIINGQAIGDMDARTYHAYKPQAMTAVLAAYERLKSQYDVVIVEGAGSPAEINLRDQDIANMGFAEAVDCPVIIAADIDRGGVFAHLLGTLELLSESERNRVVGMLINKFRGDPALLQSGNDWLEERTQKPLLAVLPYLHNLFLEAEDGLSQNWQSRNQNDVPDTVLKVAVPQLPRISNHTDFDALRANPQVDLHFVKAGQAWPQADLVILPGSKSVMSDLAWLRAQGWDAAIAKHLRYGGKVIGICGGLQMLGGAITDPDGIESHTDSCSGLGFMDFTTRLYPVKQLKQVNGRLNLPGKPEVKGYEIHAGISSGVALGQPLVQLAEAVDGVQSQDGQILGTYLHGLFDHPQACAALLRWAGLGLDDEEVTDFYALREQGINQLADMLEESIGFQKLSDILQL